MNKPHWLRLLKFRLDYFLRYIEAFGLADAVRTIHTTRMRSVKKGDVVSVLPPGFKSEVAIRHGTSDISVFEKIFVWKEYAMIVDHPVRTIVDCGGNIGLSAVWFTVAYPAARVIAIEPDAENFKLLCRNTEAYANIVPVQRAIWNRPCRLRVENPEAEPHSFRFVECPAGAADGVDACDLDTVRKDYQLDGFDILKMDIEGAEQAVFSENFDGWLNVTRMLIIEFHGEEKKRIAKAALSRFSWRHFVSGENDCFIRSGGKEEIE